ncbi:MAG TPA: hypothetical protein VK113_05290 [Gemmatimonadales bacterium]|nr:hypothetical protein [Gemmatimonadales bacterium]
MSTRPLMVWIVLAVLGSPAPAPAQLTREAMVRKSDIIFVGTVTRVGAVAAPDLPASPLTVVVRVDQVLEKPDAVGLVEGDTITVQSVRQGSLKDGMRATFYTTGWIFGDGVAVREVGHEPARAQLAAAMQQDSVARARQKVNDANLRQRIQAASVVAVGRVEEVRPAKLAAAAGHPARISEHDPEWQEAIIQVEEGFKGAQSGQRVVVRFPGSHDVAYVSTPRFAVGQEGTFLLQKDSASGSPLTMMAGQSVPAYTALHQLDVLPKQEGARVRGLMRSP